MSKLLIIQNITREGPGLFGQVLAQEGIAFDIVDLGQNQSLPNVAGYTAVVVLGGPDSANDDTDKMKVELAYIRQVLDAKISYLGICLGLQALVKAAGGQVVKGDVKEIGLINPDGNQHTITLTDEGKADPLLAGLPEKLDVFQLHGETVHITPSMSVLATSKFCQNQIVRVTSNAYGIQSHFEVIPEMLGTWAAQDPDLMPIGTDTLVADFKAIEQTYTTIGQTLFRNFLNIAGLI